MSLRLTRGEFWLLTQAVQFRLPFFELIRPESAPKDAIIIDETYHAPGHGMPLDELVQTLQELIERGWIALERGRLGTAALPCDPATIRAELAKPLMYFQGVRYRLTAAGGEVWEQFALPQWHLFIEHEYDDIYEIDESGICSHTEDPEGWRAVRVITEKATLLELYMDAARVRYEIAADSEQFDTLDDWQPFYWKPATRGERCRFRCREKADDDVYTIRPTEMFPGWCDWL